MHSIKKSIIEVVKSAAGVPYRRKVATLRDLSEESFWTYQANRFTAQYSDAIKYVEYYRAHPDRYPKNVDASLPVLETLARLPVLPKSAVKSEPTQFWRSPSLLGTAEHTTGGTTGTPLRVRASLMERGLTNAIIEERYIDLVGKPRPRILRLSGFLDHEIGDGQIFLRIPGTPFAYLSIYDLSGDRKAEIVETLGSFRPEVLHGYASALHQLALLFRDGGLPELKRPLTVVSTSETLSPSQKDDIARYLNASVFNEYGSQEGQHLVLECKFGSLHIHPARGVVEILRFEGDQPAPPGELGRVVVTGLANRTMPLIRYDIGDSAVSTGYDSSCECGCEWPTIGNIQGRSEDLVLTTDGRRIGLLSHSTLKDWDGIRESQLVQTDYDRFTYLVVPQDAKAFDFDGLERHVTKELRNRVGTNAVIEFRYVDAVPRTSSGKIRAVVVNMHGNEGTDAPGG